MHSVNELFLFLKHALLICLSNKYHSCRIYTGIHAKPKPKFKSGAISESTTALNVDQANTNVDPKNASSGAAFPVPSPLAPSTTATRGGNNQDQTAAAAAAVPPVETGGISESAATAIPAAAITQKKEVGQAKVQADKKKMDARKRSLKRL